MNLFVNPFKLINVHGVVFSDEEKKLIDLEVQKMLQKGDIRRASFDPRQFISNLLIIPKKCGDLSPVINFKPLYEFVQYHHFKMEGLNTLLDLFWVVNSLLQLILKMRTFRYSFMRTTASI